ncbi:MAG: zinc ribbon domain-containing protein [Planctomycetota bacterium]|jgi:uncharacterized Zn-finger protein
MPDDVFIDDEMAKFQAVCPNCSEVFELDEEVLLTTGAGFEDEPSVKLTCPQCEHVQHFDI